MDSPIEVRALHKRYGRTVAVDGLTFRVEPGVVTGFLGPNGAGKSTTMRVVLGLDAADGGAALVGGRPYRALRHPLREVGALLDPNAVHAGRKARDHLLWMAHSNGIARTRVAEVLDVVGLSAVAGRRVGGFSLGMRQRLGIAGALLGDPGVLLFDEPVNGLDPEGVVWIRGFLRSLAAQGRTVLVSSHLMSELQETAGDLVIIGRGRLIANTTVPDLLASVSGDQVVLRTPARAAVTTALAEAGATVAESRDGALTVTGLAAERIAGLLAGRGLPLSEMTPHRASLEEAYLQLTADAGDYGAKGSRQ